MWILRLNGKLFQCTPTLLFSRRFQKGTFWLKANFYSKWPSVSMKVSATMWGTMANRWNGRAGYTPTLNRNDWREQEWPQQTMNETRCKRQFVICHPKNELVPPTHHPRHWRWEGKKRQNFEICLLRIQSLIFSHTIQIMIYSWTKINELTIDKVRENARRRTNGSESEREREKGEKEKRA